MKPTENDPFSIFTAPLPDETPGERRAREQREIEAKKTSDQINEEVHANQEPLRRRSAVFKLLVLGQSESGKSTMIHNFRMRYGRAALKAERDPIRAVIHLKIIRSIITIVEALRAEADDKSTASYPSLPSSGKDHRSTSTPPLQPMDCRYTGSGAWVAVLSPVLLTDKHHLLRMRLSPLRAIEEDLKHMLGDRYEGVIDGRNGMLGQYPAMQEHEIISGGRRYPLKPTAAPFTALDSGNDGGSDSSPHVNTVDEITEVILSCREDMKAVWEDDTVKLVLQKRRIRLEESASFFLNDLDRIAELDYVPSDDDVERVFPRAHASGFREHRIQLSRSFGVGYGQECIMYEASGMRAVRHPYISYLEAVNAIVFLAPVSCFDERLPQDHRLNRLEDSVLLWKAVCCSKMFARAPIFLFLNKCDLLEEKLNKGVQVKKFLPSYGERPNEKNEFITYLTKQFRKIQRQESPEIRTSYIYSISTTDPKAAYFVHEAIRDNIMRETLGKSEFL